MKSTCQIEVRFRDIDALGHVNNAVYFSYFEQARIKFFADHLEQWNWEKQGLLLAHSEIDYLIPLYLNEKVSVDTWSSRLGKKSLTFMYEVFTEKNGNRTKVASGSSVLVCYDYKEKCTIVIPEDWTIKLMG